MSDGTTRRAFLGAGLAAGGVPAILNPTTQETQAGAEPGRAEVEPARRPRLAALASTYHYLSHAYHIVGRFLDGFVLHDGRGLYRPRCDVVSLYIEQTPEETDLGRPKARKHGVRLSPTIEDALTLGTGKLAVDGVLLIAEHGDYPTNEKLQKLYPRYEYFQEVTRVFAAAKRSVPVFVDKHLSYDRNKAQAMVERARELRFPLMAGSSLPVTWRLPALELPLQVAIQDALVASRGEIEIFGFHALETLQCFVERRDRKGAAQGVKAVTCLSGDAVWEAGDRRVWSWDLLAEALRRSHTLNPGDVRDNTRDFVPPPGRPTFLKEPLAFVVEYVDGLKATALILNGHVDDTTFACRYGAAMPSGPASRPGGASPPEAADSDPQSASTLVYLPAPPGARFFDALTLRIEAFLRSGEPPYPIQRTLLTGGILDAALESRHHGGQRVVTPDLAAIDYAPPADSGFIRTPVAGRG